MQSIWFFKALGANILRNRVNKGFDLKHESYGRIEVRSRRYPLDERREDRVRLPKVKLACSTFSFTLSSIRISVSSGPILRLMMQFGGIGICEQKPLRDAFLKGGALSKATDITTKVKKGTKPARLTNSRKLYLHKLTS